MPDTWPLYVALALAVIATICWLCSEDTCPDTATGDHERVFESEVTAGCLVWRTRCQHCGRASAGIQIPWIRFGG